MACGLGEGGGRALAETLRLNTTHSSLDLGYDGLEESGGRGLRALADMLRLNTILSSYELFNNDLGEGGGWGLNTTLMWLNLGVDGLKLGGAGRDTASQHHPLFARP
jgi:hypothetical protein